MKKVIKFIFIITVVTFCLTGCQPQNQDSEPVSDEDMAYKEGFYGDLFPTNIIFSDETYNWNGQEYRRVIHDKFDLVHANVGEYTSGTLYCAKEQWEEAKENYSNPNNFRYYCKIGAPKVDKDPEIIEIPDVDVEIFGELLEFAAESGYDPFGPEPEVEKVELPIPNDEESPRLIFYKESKDGCFTSLKDAYFHIIGEELYLVYYYDYGHGEYEKLIAVLVPEEISDYMIEYLEGKIS